ncbi:MAG: Nif3-like dinuclear metal center hexameric protein [Acetobacteraceae bacterium]|nr:Nif3-like dinuclear metal center hexameric protein [Acetobacteraceae bacterium]
MAQEAHGRAPAAPLVSDVVALIEELAPPELAEPGDRIGFMLGDPGALLTRVLFALDLTSAVLEEAVQAGAGLLVLHHPPPWAVLDRATLDRPAGRLLCGAVRAGLAVYVAHTNWDWAPRGVADALARRLALADPRPLVVAGTHPHYKLVVFVPKGYEDAVRDAMAEAGAGWIGKYSHCTFMAPGTGTFKAQEGAQPFLGRVGELEKAEEHRLETIVPRAALPRVLQAMRAAHPYEEVAYDVYRLENPGVPWGRGRVGRLARPCTLGELADRVKAVLGVDRVRLVGGPGVEVRILACTPGRLVPGGLEAARAQGAEALVVGEARYAEVLEAAEAGLGLIEAGHYATEAVGLSVLASLVQDRLVERGFSAQATVSAAGRDPVRCL